MKLEVKLRRLTT